MIWYLHIMIVQGCQDHSTSLWSLIIKYNFFGVILKYRRHLRSKESSFSLQSFQTEKRSMNNIDIKYMSSLHKFCLYFRRWKKKLLIPCSIDTLFKKRDLTFDWYAIWDSYNEEVSKAFALVWNKYTLQLFIYMYLVFIFDDILWICGIIVEDAVLCGGCDIIHHGIILISRGAGFVRCCFQVCVTETVFSCDHSSLNHVSYSISVRTREAVIGWVVSAYCKIGSFTKSCSWNHTSNITPLLLACTRPVQVGSTHPPPERVWYRLHYKRYCIVLGRLGMI